MSTDETISPFLSIIIVNWNTHDLLHSCLESIPSGNPLEPYEVIVVDNGSGDGSVSMMEERFPHVRLLCNSRNLGFAKGTNQGVSLSRGTYLLFLNTDIVVLPDSIRTLCNFMDRHPQVGAAAPQLRYPDGTIQKSCRSFPRPLPLLFACLGLDRLFPGRSTLSAWKMQYWDHQDTRPVEQPMMSAFLVRRTCWEEVGELDELFPNYFNDVDWCYRLRRKTSWQIYHVSDAAMIHHHGQTCKKLGYRRISQSSSGLHRFYEKHFRISSSYAVHLVCITGIGILTAGRYALEYLKSFRGSRADQPY